MVLFNPWALSEYRSADILLWVAGIIAVVFAFFLLVEYFNTKKINHVLWAISLIITFVVFHIVANSGTYSVLLSDVLAGLTTLIPGLIAAGLLYSVFEDKKLLGRFRYGHVYIIFILVLTLFNILSRFNFLKTSIAYWDIVTARGTTTYTPVLEYEGLTNTLGLDEFSRLWVPQLLSGLSVIPSMAIIVGLPLYTTYKTKETGKSALLVSVGGFLLGLSGIFLFLLTRTLTIGTVIVDVEGVITVYDNIITGEGLLIPLDGYIMLGLFAYLILFSVGFFVIGLLYEKKWSFDIPGIEFID